MAPSPCLVLSTQTLREVALLFKHYGMDGLSAVNELEQLVKAAATALMDTIIANDVFTSKGGDLVSMYG